MKISTSLNYQRALTNIQNANAEVSKTREQVSTGKLLVRPSDDPTKVATIENLDRAIAKSDTYTGLLGDLKQRYELEETVLLSGSDILVRLKELAIQASNDTLAIEDRRIVALEVAGLKKELLNIANTQDVSLTKVDRSNYAALPNKLNQGQPSQYYVDRQTTPKIYLYQAPDASTYTYVKFYVVKRIEDAGAYSNNPDAVFRFLPCMVAGLAYYLSLKIPEAAPRITMLKQEYEEQWLLASTEDREKATLSITPRSSYV